MAMCQPEVEAMMMPVGMDCWGAEQTFNGKK